MHWIIAFAVLAYIIYKLWDYIVFVFWTSVVVALISFVWKISRNNKISSINGTYRVQQTEKSFDLMSGVEFEQYCASLLRKNGFCKITLTSSTGDHGVDIIAHKDGRMYVFQCKRYQSKVGNKAIQEVYSGKGLYGADVAVVMTNNYFTPQAINDAVRLNVQLWDRNKIMKM